MLTSSDKKPLTPDQKLKLDEEIGLLPGQDLITNKHATQTYMLYKLLHPDAIKIIQ